MFALLLLFALPVATQTTAPATIQESAVSFVSEGLNFPAILTLPKRGNSAPPLVVLVAGSGPQDADESIGPNKPFRDIAQGLAERGIATLRYPKRTRIAPSTMTGDHLTLDWEVKRDAVAALAFASTLKEIDPTRIFLLGHSLGGTMAPAISRERLMQKKNSVAGTILFAPGILPIDKTFIRQVLTQNKRAGATEVQLLQIETQLNSMFLVIENPVTPDDTPSGLGGGTTVRYWRDWLGQDPIADLKNLTIPSLVVRGLKDIQVSHEDYAAILPAQRAPRSAHKEISNLNHLGFAVDGASTGKEYMQPGHVSPTLIDLVSNWILTN